MAPLPLGRARNPPAPYVQPSAPPPKEFPSAAEASDGAIPGHADAAPPLPDPMDEASRDGASPVAATIPLPEDKPPEWAVFPRLATRLANEGLVPAATARLCMDLFHADHHLLASEHLLRAWLAAHRQGRRPKSERTVFTPSSSLFPELKPTSFVPANLEVLLQGELREVSDFLLDGFQHGFRLQRDPSWSSV